MPTPKITILDKEEEMLEHIRLLLEREGYHITCLRGDNHSFERIIESDPDLIVMDIVLPEMDGVELCQQIRKYTDVPIVFVSEKCADVDMVVGLSAGGDDYLAKPFSSIEFVARVKAHLRRSNLVKRNYFGRHQMMKFGELEINLSAQTASVNGADVLLSAREFKLLTQLAQHPGRVFSMDELYELVWGTRSIVDTGTVMVHISNLRKKLKKGSESHPYILTVRGAGYKFNENI